MKVSLIALFLVFIGGGRSSPSLVIVDASSAAAAGAATHDASSQASEAGAAATAASLRGSRRVMAITAPDLRGLEKEEKCGKGEDCDEVAERPAGEQEEEVEEAEEVDKAEKCKGKECGKKDEVEEQQSASEDQDEETFVDEEAENDETDASTVTPTVADSYPGPVKINQEEKDTDTTDTNPAMPDEEEVVDEDAGAQTSSHQEPQQSEQEEEAADTQTDVAEEETPPPAVDEGEDNELIVFEDTPTAEDVNIEASPDDTTEATVVEPDAFPGPTYTGTSGTATSLTTGESGTAVASQGESGGLQPAGKALLSVALSGAFVAILAAFLVRRKRRNSHGGALTPYSPTKDDSYFIDRDESMEATASSSGSPDKTSRELVMVGTGETVAIDHIESGSQEGYECNELATVPPTAIKPYGPEEPPVNEEAPPLKLSLVGGSSILSSLPRGPPILSSLPRQVESPAKSKSSAIVPHTPTDEAIVSSPQLSPDGDLEVYEDVAYAEDEANTIRAIVRKYQVENTVEM
eukprot:CAMPEP_0178524572 /NCGR_PEP_ID=MMETSP0696-20121128/29715_1 /TAXON_ID=265572 /ORGANISM="Extubocellulus spinifer, Strain CCMP396" /LENGTH=520 /DNA_ID=CAMNT_0020155917 /DNA_START=14 /DNA_END=1576 /DNA_ORIENTATION=-